MVCLRPEDGHQYATLKLKVAIQGQTTRRPPSKPARRAAGAPDREALAPSTSARIAGKSKSWLYGEYMGTISTVRASTRPKARPNLGLDAGSRCSLPTQTAPTNTAIAPSTRPPPGPTSHSNIDWFWVYW